MHDDLLWKGQAGLSTCLLFTASFQRIISCIQLGRIINYAIQLALQQVATMPIKVYVWKPKDDDSYGHASMELSDGTYISWWPLQGGKPQKLGSKGLAFPKQTVDTDQPGEGNVPVQKQTVDTDQPGEGSVPVQKQTLDDDVQDEGRNPDLVFVVPSKVGLKEDDVKSWWENIQSKDDWNLCNNCYGAVKRAVETGGAKVDASFTETQSGLIKYMEEMRKMNWEPPQNRIKKFF